LTTTGTAVYLFRLVPGNEGIGAVFQGFTDAIAKHKESIQHLCDAELTMATLLQVAEKAAAEETEAIALLDYRVKQVEEDDAEAYRLLQKDYDRLKFTQEKNARWYFNCVGG
jgi:hypothetical protein